MEKGHFPHLPRKEEHPKRGPSSFFVVGQSQQFSEDFFRFFPPLVGVTPKQNETVTFFKKGFPFSVSSFGESLCPATTKKGLFLLIFFSVLEKRMV